MELSDGAEWARSERSVMSKMSDVKNTDDAVRFLTGSLDLLAGSALSVRAAAHC